MEGDTQELFVWRYHQGRLLPLYKGEIETCGRRSVLL